MKISEEILLEEVKAEYTRQLTTWTELNHKCKICFGEKNPIQLLKRVKAKHGEDPDVVTSFLGKEKLKFSF